MGVKKPLDLTKNGERWCIPMALFDALLFAQDHCARSRNELQALPSRMPDTPRAQELMQELIGIIKDGFKSAALQSVPHCILLREDFYSVGQPGSRSIKAVLSDWLLLKLRPMNVAKLMPDKTGLTDEQLVVYIRDGPGNDEVLKAQFDKLKAADRQILNLSRDWLVQYLVHAMQKINRVSFGMRVHLQSNQYRSLQARDAVPKKRGHSRFDV